MLNRDKELWRAVGQRKEPEIEHKWAPEDFCWAPVGRGQMSGTLGYGWGQGYSTFTTYHSKQAGHSRSWPHVVKKPVYHSRENLIWYQEGGCIFVTSCQTAENVVADTAVVLGQK